MLWPNRNSYKEFDNEKNSCGSKIPLPPPPPPHNVSNGPSLSQWKITLGKEEIYRGGMEIVKAQPCLGEKKQSSSH